MYIMLTELLSGLALFLFGMKFMSESLQKAAGEKLRDILNSVTKNKYVAVLFGALFTAVIQSSGATTVMEVSFVNAGIMTLEQSVGITFGANIGTTITSQLVSLKLTAVAPFIIFIGAAIIMFGKKPFMRKVAEIIFGFGALFLGINFMTGALSSLQDFPTIMQVFACLENPFVAVVLGFVLTFIVQSSSVTVSVLVLLADSGLVGLLSCLYFILGANIGSCTPAVMAGLNSSKEAKRTAFIHVMFNVIGMVVISAILFFAKDWVVDTVSALSGVGNAKRFVANADTLFKTFQCLILLPCSGGLVKLVRFLIPEGEEECGDTERKLMYIGKNRRFMESTAIIDIVHEIERMARMVQDNLIMSMDALLYDKLENVEKIQQQELYIDYLSSEITEYLVETNKYQLPLSDAARIGGLFHVVIDVERIGDHAVNVTEAAVKKKDRGIRFTEEGGDELTDVFMDVLDIYDKSIEMFVTDDQSNLGEITYLEDNIDRKQIDYQEGHVRRMSMGRCSIEAGLIFTDLLIGLERIGDHAVNIAHSLRKEKPEEDA
ncbi:MAG: Na/Pi cotransporter family protein [Lachnospiraceae bacterium]|nr:Na/Pi cotransporter family protein [Lachnospiraceae bacterium]